MKTLSRITFILIILVFSNNLLAEPRPASPEQVAMVTMSVAAHSRNIQALDHIDIYVIGNNNIAEALKKYKDQRVGKPRIRKVTFGDKLPTERPAIIICGNDDYADMVKNYTRTNRVMSVGTTHNSGVKGLSLSISQDSDDDEGSISKVVIFLNLTASFYEEVYWDKNISTVAKSFSPCEFNLGSVN